MYVVKSQIRGGLGLNQAKLKTFAVSPLLALIVTFGATTTRGGELPEILHQPTNQSAIFFGSTIFSVTAGGGAPLSYQWIFNGEPIANATNSDLILGPLTCAQSGYYNVIVSNLSGAVSSFKAQLTVYQAIVSNTNFAEGQGAQEFLLQFTNVMAATVGSFTVYTVKSDGTVAGYNRDEWVLNPPPGLADVVAIAGGPYNAVALTGDGMVAAWGVIGPASTPGGLSNVTAVAAGNEFDIALQSNGMVIEWPNESSYTTLPYSNVVAIAAGQNQFLALLADGTVAEWEENSSHLVSGLSNVIAISAGSASLALKADGTVAGWDGVATNPLPNVSNVVAIAAGESGFLVLKSDGTVTTSAPSLSFPFALSNVFAMAAPSALGGIVLLNDRSPVFTVQPGNQILKNGGTVWLHARAVGAQPMSYQWQLNGISILDATNADLTITNAQGNEGGQYCALASNSVGSASSRLASVTISSGSSSYTLAQALNDTNLTWSASGNAAWFSETDITQDGVAAAQSGAIGNSMYSELETTVTGPGTLTFWWMVSSEEYFDFLSFYIDSETSAIVRISGEVDWQQQTFPIGSGSHNLIWVYAKDPDVSVGQDAGWLDQVSFVPTPVPAQLGVPTLLSDGSLLFNVYTTNGTTLALSDPAGVIFETSSNLVDWIPLTNALTLTNGAAVLSDPAATNSPVRFYRLMRQ
jgi:hypothetical protein